MISPLGTTRGGGHGLDAEKAAGGQLIPIPVTDVSAPLQGRIGNGRGSATVSAEEAVNLQVTYSVVPEGGQGADLRASEVDVSTALDSRNKNNHDRGIRVVAGTSVRRLTPVECERLQALPDGWTLIPRSTDSRRYSAVGDAVTVTVAEWIGRRLVEAMS